MHVDIELNADELEAKLREKERAIAARLQRILPRQGNHGGGGVGSASRLWFGEKQRRILMLAGGALALLGLPSEVRPRRVEARLKPNRIGQLAFVTGLTLVAFAWGRRLGQRGSRGLVFDAQVAPYAPPSAGGSP